MRVVDLNHIYRSRPYPSRPLDWITDLIVHHSEGRTPTSDADALSLIAEIDAFHRGPQRGWPGIAYHMAIWDETLYLLRSWELQGWHSAGMDTNPRNGIGDGNDHGVAVVLLGTYTNREPDSRTLATIEWAWGFVEQELGRNVSLTGHQDWWATGCPGNGWPTWKQKIKKPSAHEPEEEDMTRIEELEAEKATLVNALAYVCDDLGDKLETERYRPRSPRKRELHGIVGELRRVRRQFLGLRP